MKSPTFDLSMLRHQAKFMACAFIVVNGMSFIFERTLRHGLILLLAIVAALSVGYALRRFSGIWSFVGAVAVSMMMAGAVMLWMRPHDLVPMSLGAFYYALLGRLGLRAPLEESKA